MQFVNILMLFGLGAVAIPVVIQLLTRKNVSVVRWGAWMFLDLTMKRRKRRVLLEDILLLACRCLIPALAALAFARPFVRPDSPVPWAVVMPLLLLSITLFGVSFALWRYPKWRRNMMAGGILLFALAMAAVMFERHLNLKRFGLGASKDIALIVDGSSSMSMVHDGKSNFERGVAEARKYIEEAPRGTAFAVILGGPVPQVLNPVPIADKRVLMNTLERLVPANGTMQIAPNLTAAAVTLASGHNAVKQIVIIGDGQTVGWQLDYTDRWRTIRRVFSQLKSAPVIVWRTLPLPTSIRNLAVSEVRPSRGVVGTDREVKINVTVVNAGTEAVTPNGVSVSIGSDTRSAANLRQLEPGESQTFSFPYRFKTPGGTMITARVDSEDDLPADDTYRYVLPVMQSLKVLVVDGESNADPFRRGSTYVALALRPELEHLVAANGTQPAQPGQPAQEGGGSAEKGFLLDTKVEDITVAGRRSGFGGFAAVVLMNVPRLPEPLMASLAGYVNSGGGLFFMPGPLTDRDLFNGWRFENQPVLPLTLGKNISNVRDPAERRAIAEGRVDAKDAKRLAAVDPASFGGDAIRQFRTGSDLGTVEPPSFVELLEGVSGGASVIAKFTTGQPFLAEKQLGRGTVCVSAMPFDLDSGIVAKRGFVPLMHEIAYHLARPVAVRLDVAPSDGVSVLLASGSSQISSGVENGLMGYYFPKPKCEGKPKVRRDKKLSFHWGGGSPMKDIPADNFSVRWRGSIVAPETGRYKFDVKVDDAFTFKIGGKTGRIFEMTKGEAYPFEAEYGEFYGEAALVLMWTPPGGKPQSVPESAFRITGFGAADVVEIKDPHGESFYGEIMQEKDGTFLHISRSVMPGVYTVVSIPDYLKTDLAGVITPEGQIQLSVTAGVEESTMEAVTQEQVEKLGEFVHVSTATKEEDVMKAIGGQSFGKEVWRTLAFAAFVFMILEIAVARWIAITRRTGEDIQVDFKNDKLQASEAFKRSVAKLNAKEGGVG